MKIIKIKIIFNYVVSIDFLGLVMRSSNQNFN
jgi:hypothetical protein